TPEQTEAQAKALDGFSDYVLEHIADKPMTFMSKGQLRRYCRERGLASSALL
ncbi:hypothetical protein LCGC14_2544410, partial [marine sediment metagenome]